MEAVPDTRIYCLCRHSRGEGCSGAWPYEAADSLPASNQAVWVGAPLGPGLKLRPSASWMRAFRSPALEAGMDRGGQCVRLSAAGVEGSAQNAGLDRLQGAVLGDVGAPLAVGWT